MKNVNKLPYIIASIVLIAAIIAAGLLGYFTSGFRDWSFGHADAENEEAASISIVTNDSPALRLVSNISYAATASSSIDNEITPEPQWPITIDYMAYLSPYNVPGVLKWSCSLLRGDVYDQEKVENWIHLDVSDDACSAKLTLDMCVWTSPYILKAEYIWDSNVVAESIITVVERPVYETVLNKDASGQTPLAIGQDNRLYLSQKGTTLGNLSISYWEDRQILVCPNEYLMSACAEKGVMLKPEVRLDFTIENRIWHHFTPAIEDLVESDSDTAHALEVLSDLASDPKAGFEVSVIIDMLEDPYTVVEKTVITIQSNPTSCRYEVAYDNY